MKQVGLLALLVTLVSSNVFASTVSCEFTVVDNETKAFLARNKEVFQRGDKSPIESLIYNQDFFYRVTSDAEAVNVTLSHLKTKAVSLVSDRSIRWVDQKQVQVPANFVGSLSINTGTQQLNLTAYCQEK